MPIILLWNAAAIPYERQFKRWLKEIEVYGSLIGKWLKARVKQTESMERQSRGFPVVLFYNLSLTARLSPFQRGALLPAGPPGLDESFARIGAAWNLPAAWKTKRDEAQLLPKVFAMLARITGAARASVERLHDAPTEMFTPGSLKAVDLIGLGSLTFRSVGQGREGILATTTRLRDALRDRKARNKHEAVVAGSGAAIPDAATAERAGLPLAMQLDNLIHTIAGGLMIIPAAAALLQKVGADICLYLRNTVMDQLVGIERKVLDFRQSLLTGINIGLQQFAHVVVGMLVVVREQLSDVMRHYILFTARFMDGLTRGVEAFFKQFQTLWSGIHRIIQNTMGFLTVIATMNLGPLLHSVFVLMEKAVRDLNKIFTLLATLPLPSGAGSILGTAMRFISYSAPGEFSCTVEELVLNEPPGARAHKELQKGLDAVSSALGQLAMFGITTSLIEGQLAKRGYNLDIDGIVKHTKVLLKRIQQDPVTDGGLPKKLTLKFGKMPDVDALFLQPAKKAIVKGLRDGGTAIRQGAEDLTVSIVDFLDSTAVTFVAAADATTTSKLHASIPDLREAAGEEVLANFDSGQLRINATGMEPLAEAYKAWLVQSAPKAGMQMTGAAVSGYLSFVLDEWDRRQPEGAETPVEVTETSPRILLEKARLGRVYVPKLVIRATGQETDAQLAERVAEGFRSSVADAWASGQSVLKGYAETARKREEMAAEAAKRAKTTPLPKSEPAPGAEPTLADGGAGER